MAEPSYPTPVSDECARRVSNDVDRYVALPEADRPYDVFTGRAEHETVAWWYVGAPGVVLDCHRRASRRIVHAGDGNHPWMFHEQADAEALATALNIGLAARSGTLDSALRRCCDMPPPTGFARRVEAERARVVAAAVRAAAAEVTVRVAAAKARKVDDTAYWASRPPAF